MIAAALALAEQGMFVFPCLERGKTPLTPNGFKDATRDPEVISAWWKRWLYANIGVACGPSNIVVIDVNPGHGGDESIADLRALHGFEITETVTALTGGGGEQLYFNAPPVAIKDNNTGALGQGIDFKSAGGYVVAPPSIHESGYPYLWEVSYELGEFALKDLPNSIIHRLNHSAAQLAVTPR